MDIYSLFYDYFVEFGLESYGFFSIEFLEMVCWIATFVVSIFPLWFTALIIKRFYL